MSESLKLGHALNRALSEVLELDPAVVLLGEDIGRLGGVFRITRGLQDKFGPNRVQDFVLAESSIIGAAIGLSLCGYRPVCEIQFESFVYPAANQLITQAARMQIRIGDGTPLPLVVRIPYGGGFGGIEHHSESNEAIFAHINGLSVVVCSSALDAGALLHKAITMDSPVVFFEPKAMYWKPVELPDAGLPDNTEGGRILMLGDEVTVVSYGAMLKRCYDAVIGLMPKRSVELIDLRWLRPLDVDTVVASVKKTGRLVIVHEASRFGGLGAELAAKISSLCFGELLAPVVRIGACDNLYPPSAFEEQHLPSESDIINAIRGVVSE
nr:transketolase C-terminal domain-containing protein [Mycobacteroides abscessus]